MYRQKLCEKKWVLSFFAFQFFLVNSYLKSLNFFNLVLKFQSFSVITEKKKHIKINPGVKRS